jgi:hypothetical protein
MDTLIQRMRVKTESKGLNLAFKIAAEVPVALVGDSMRLGQVLANLGNNAVKFTESGDIVIGVEKVSEVKNGVELHFWVKDSGIGMHPEQCEKILSHLNATSTRKYGGTGLGLAIAKSLVQLMQGRLWVESKARMGSTFHFHAHFGLQADAYATKNIASHASSTRVEPQNCSEDAEASPFDLDHTLDKLRSLLEESDAEAGDLLGDLLDKIAGTPMAKALKPVATAIEAFDFDEALTRLNKVCVK